MVDEIFMSHKTNVFAMGSDGFEEHDRPRVRYARPPASMNWMA
jgi:hypothetical protein